MIFSFYLKLDFIPPNALRHHSIIPACRAEVTPWRDEGGYSMVYN
jgi:hypothetical protein